MTDKPTGQIPSAGLPRVVTLGGTALPLVGRARVYACGITPYDVTHLGHAATFVWVDTLVRVLHAGGAEVVVCRNVTDVDDVLLAAANRADIPYDRFAAASSTSSTSVTLRHTTTSAPPACSTRTSVSTQTNVAA